MSSDKPSKNPYSRGGAGNSGSGRSSNGRSGQRKPGQPGKPGQSRAGQGQPGKSGQPGRLNQHRAAKGGKPGSRKAAQGGAPGQRRAGQGQPSRSGQPGRPGRPGQRRAGQGQPGKSGQHRVGQRSRVSQAGQPGRPGARKPGQNRSAQPGKRRAAAGAVASQNKRPQKNGPQRNGLQKNGPQTRMKKDGSRSVGEGKLKARTRKKRSWRDKRTLRNFFAGLAAVMAVMIIVPLVAFFTAYSVTKVPEPEELVNNQISYIMASDNNTELARIVPPEGNRQNVKLDEVPMAVRQAVLAAEDREFYSNPGFSVSGFARAAVGQVLGRDGAGGGSTITQQYVKNALVGDEFSLSRKAKELVISAKMAREWSKDEILEAYLNTIYFGRNAYGISAAAHAYFDKDVKELSPEEGAVLAATIQAPSGLDPWTNRERAESRWNYVLDGMVGIGAMKEADRKNAVYPKVKDPAETAESTQAAGTNGLIKTKVIEELEQAGITEEQVNTGGLKITTTIDPKMQAEAVDEIHKKMEGQQKGLRTAVVSVDPKTGGVRSWYGGDDPVGFDFAGAGLQTGSTFKIFTLAAYLDQGGSIYDQFDSSPVMTGDAQVTNVGGASCGTCSIAEALKQSLNTSFIRLTQSLKGGPQDVADMAHRLGVAEELPGVGKTLQEKNGKPADGITLGMYQSSPLDMATALATMTNGGVYHRPHFVQKVENSNGDVLLDNTKDDGDRVVSEEVANGVIQAMQPIAAYSNGNVLAGGRPSAAKTGTAQLGDTGENKDAWMLGSTPQLSTAVWVGTADGKPIHNSYGGIMYGSGLPAQIWKGVLDRQLADSEIEQFGTGAAASSGSSGAYSGGGGADTGADAGAGAAAGAGTEGEAQTEPESPAPAAPPSPQSPQPAPRQPAPRGGNPPANNDLQDLIDGFLNQ